MLLPNKKRKEDKYHGKTAPYQRRNTVLHTP